MLEARGWLVLAAAVLAASAVGVAVAQEDRPRRVENVSLQDEGCPQGPDRFCVQPAEITLEEGTDLVLRVTNEGRTEHNLTFPAGTPAPLAEHGMNGTLAVDETHRLRIPWTAFEESFEDGQANATLHCGLDGHAALGERLTIEVPSLAAGEERPQPGPGAWAALGALGIVALAARRRDE